MTQPFAFSHGNRDPHNTSLFDFALSHPLHYIWGLAATVWIFIATFVLGWLSIILMFITRRGWPIESIGPIWARSILRACGIRVDLEGVEHVEAAQSCILISNHLSNFDIWCTLAMLPKTVRFVAKKELTTIPIFGWALAMSDHIIIDRDDSESAIRTINKSAAKSPEGIAILFYGEGTRSRDGKVGAFKKGGATLALRSGLPIIPMSVSGTRKFLPRACWIIRPDGRVKLRFSEPIATAGMSLDQRAELTEEVRKRVLDGYVEDY